MFQWLIFFYRRVVFFYSVVLQMRYSFKQTLGLYLNGGMNMGIDLCIFMEEEFEVEEKVM